MPIPRQPAPALDVPTLDHGRFDLASATPERWTLVCFYRGLHCPICAAYLTELEKQVPAFAERGVECIAVSSDGEERARAMADKIADKAGSRALRFGYGMPLATAREWGLHISTSRGTTSIGIEEPALFSEPGLFLIRTDGTVYYMSVQSMPFVRPNFRELAGAVDFAIEKDYPARGEYTGALD
jgi:alkyl hydroperoxide reductase subunit AhpC